MAPRIPNPDSRFLSSPVPRLNRDTTRQFRLPFDAPAAEPSATAVVPLLPSSRLVEVPPVHPPAVEPDSPLPPARLLFVRHRRARRYILRVRPDGIVRVTIPRGGTKGGAAAFAERQRAWIADQLAKVRRASEHGSRPLAAGDRVLLRGTPTAIEVRPAHRGRVRVTLGDAPACLTTVADDLRPAVTAILRALAARELPSQLEALASQHGLAVTRVSIRNQRTRWGSCASHGAISLNWRLVQMPPEVRDYVLLHELMHLREANHSRRFWKHVAAACPWHVEARRWLAREGRGLL